MDTTNFTFDMSIHDDWDTGTDPSQDSAGHNLDDEMLSQKSLVPPSEPVSDNDFPDLASDHDDILPHTALSAVCLSTPPPYIPDGGSSDNDGDDAPLRKRSHAQRRVVDSPPASPEKKKVRVASMTHMALDIVELGDKPRGIMRFFKPATQEEREEQVSRDLEIFQTRKSQIQSDIHKDEVQKTHTSRERAREHQQKHRERKKAQEIQNGERSPGGRKQKVEIYLKIKF